MAEDHGAVRASRAGVELRQDGTSPPALLADTPGDDAGVRAGSIEINLAAAVEHLRAAEYKDAFVLLTGVVDACPEWAAARAYLGLTCYFLGDIPTAQWHLDEAIQLDAQDFLVWAKRGEFWLRLACYPQATADFQRALALPAPSGTTRRWVAGLLHEAQQRGKGSFTRTIVSPQLGSWGSWTAGVRRLGSRLNWLSRLRHPVPVPAAAGAVVASALDAARQGMNG